MSHFSISDARVLFASNSGITNNQASLFLIAPTISSSPNTPSNFIKVLLLINSGRSGYTANA